MFKMRYSPCTTIPLNIDDIFELGYLGKRKKIDRTSSYLDIKSITRITITVPIIRRESLLLVHQLGTKSFY